MNCQQALFFSMKALEIATESFADSYTLTTCQLSLAEAYRKVGKNNEAITISEVNLGYSIVDIPKIAKN